MKYFEGITDADHAKVTYRSWAKKLHPDKGGSDEAMQELTEQYAEWLKSQGVEEIDEQMLDELHIPQHYRDFIMEAMAGYLTEDKSKMIRGTVGLLASAVLEGLKNTK